MDEHETALKANNPWVIAGMLLLAMVLTYFMGYRDGAHTADNAVVMRVAQCNAESLPGEACYTIYEPSRPQCGYNGVWFPARKDGGCYTEDAGK